MKKITKNTTKKVWKLTDVHRERLGILINYLQQKLSFGETMELKRSKINEIIGITEGDSAKVIFYMLKECPNEYSDKITYTYNAEKNTHVFGIADTNVFTAATSHSIAEFKNVINTNGKMICLLSAEQLVNLWITQTITYNPDLQRGKKEVKKGGKIEEQDICSETNIKEIAELMAQGRYVTDTIILNIMNCNVYFKDNILSIEKLNKNSEFNILDGQHRVKACLLFKEMIAKKETEHSLAEYMFPIQIEQMPLEQAQSAFSQFTKGLKITTTRKEFLDNNSPYTEFLKSAFFDEDSFYKNKVEIVKDKLSGTNKFVSFGTLASALKQEVKETELNSDLCNYFKQFFNLLGEQINKIDSAFAGLIRNNLAYYGYIGVVKSMFDKKTPKTEFTTIIHKLLSKLQNEDSSLWVGKVLIEGKRGYKIVNKKDTRMYMANICRSFL